MSVHISRSSLLKKLGLAVIVFGVVLFCYWPALHGSLLWDDPAHVPREEIQSWEGLRRIWTDFRATQQYYPVLFSAFWVEHRLWGDNTFGYHTVNVVLHSISCCLLALILRRLWSMPGATRLENTARVDGVAPGAEWIAALLFAVHPVCVESVAWITEQKNTLALVFYLLAALVYLGFCERRRPWLYVAASVLFLCALGAKTVTVTLPASLLVLVWWKRGGRLLWRSDVVPLLPWFFAAGAIGLITSWIERKIIGAEGAVFDLSWVERGFLAGRVVWFYLGKVFWPFDLMFFYPRWDVSTAWMSWSGYLLGEVGLTAALLLRWRQNPGLVAGWLLFLAALAPILGFFNVFFFQFSYVNDHFLYLGCLSPIALVCAGLWKFTAHPARAYRIGIQVLMAGVIGTLAFFSHRQSALYRDSETLFRATIARNPASWMAHHILGFTLAKAPDRHAEAIAEYEQAIRLNPDYPDPHMALGVELARLPGRRDDAIAEYERALKLRPFYAEAHNNLAVELAKQPGHLEEVLEHCKAAIRYKPDFAEAHANLGDALTKQSGQMPEAIQHYEIALRIKPSLSWVHCNLALCLTQTPGRESDAIAHFKSALQLKPDFAEAHNGLAIVYVRQGQLDQARAEWEAALRLDPSYETARRNLRRLEQMMAR